MNATSRNQRRTENPRLQGGPVVLRPVSPENRQKCKLQANRVIPSGRQIYVGYILLDVFVL